MSLQQGVLQWWCLDRLPTYKKSADAMQGVGELPQLQRLRAYRRIAEKPVTQNAVIFCVILRVSASFESVLSEAGGAIPNLGEKCVRLDARQVVQCFKAGAVRCNYSSFSS